MSHRKLQKYFLLFLCAGLGLICEERQNSGLKYQAAIQKEQAEGDLRGAMRLYESIASDGKATRPERARALIRLAECHEKLGEKNAVAVYQKVTREYADQEEAVARARARLGALER